MENTTLFDVSVIESANVKNVIKEVCSLLKERGYNPINQLVGYFMSGDPGYISSYKGARDKILTLDKAQALQVIIKDFLKYYLAKNNK